MRGEDLRIVNRAAPSNNHRKQNARQRRRSIILNFDHSIRIFSRSQLISLCFSGLDWQRFRFTNAFLYSVRQYSLLFLSLSPRHCVCTWSTLSKKLRRGLGRGPIAFPINYSLKPNGNAHQSKDNPPPGTGI